jgi:hypothetical protein
LTVNNGHEGKATFGRHPGALFISAARAEDTKTDFSESFTRVFDPLELSQKLIFQKPNF